MTSTRAPVVLALLASVTLGVVAWTWRTGAVGGSDSACYALMTKAYAEGRWQPDSPLARQAPWPDATRVAAPGGFLPSATQAGAAVPVCAPGYSLLVAPFARLGGLEAVHVVPPVAATLLVWLAFVLTRRLATAWAGVGAALLVATSPVVLFQAVQPMNDITTGALWVGVAVAMLGGHPLTTGALTGLGLLVRPNLAPAAVVAVVACGVMAARAHADDRLRHAIVAMTVAALAALPGVAIALALNVSLYGSPFQSGYGDLGALFAWTHVPENVVRYGRAWLVTSTPVVLLALAAPFVAPPATRLASGLVAGLAVALAVVYLAYRPFAEWWYLRFLLPGIVLSIVLAMTVLAALVDRAGRPWALALGIFVVGAAAFTSARSDHAREALGLMRLESRFPLTSAVVTARLPASAVLVTGWQSGAVRFRPGREVVMWDALDPAWLDGALAWLTAHGRTPAIVLEPWEHEAFRVRFARQDYGALDWPPRYDLERRVQIFLPEDRARYRAGETVATERVFEAGRARGR